MVIEESILRFIALLIPITLMGFASLVFYLEYKKNLLMLARRIQPPKRISLNQAELEMYRRSMMLVTFWVMVLMGLTWTFQEMGWLGKEFKVPWIPLILLFFGIAGLLNHYKLSRNHKEG